MYASRRRILKSRNDLAKFMPVFPARRLPTDYVRCERIKGAASANAKMKRALRQLRHAVTAYGDGNLADVTKHTGAALSALDVEG